MMNRYCCRSGLAALLVFTLFQSPALAVKEDETEAPAAEVQVKGPDEDRELAADDEAEDSSGTEQPVQNSKFALSFEYVNYGLPNFRFVGSQDAGLGARMGYGGRLAFEWHFLRTDFGVLGFGAGVGLGVKDNVEFTAVDLTQKKASLTIVPLDLFLIYHLIFTRYQFAVPFAKVGGGITAGWQTSVTGADVARTLTYSRFDWGVGLQICLSTIDRSAQKDLEIKFGIEAVYIVLEYLKSSKLAGTPEVDLSGDRITAGLRFEF